MLNKTKVRYYEIISFSNSYLGEKEPKHNKTGGTALFTLKSNLYLKRCLEPWWVGNKHWSYYQ